MMQNVIENKYIKIGSVVAIFLGLFADFMSTPIYFAVALVVVSIFTMVAFFDEKKKKKIYTKQSVPVPIVISVDSTKSTNHVFDMLIKRIETSEKFENLEENLKKYLNIVKDDIVFHYTGSVYDKERLTSFLQIIRYKLNQIEINMKSNVEFHVAYYERPAIGFLIGAIFKTDGIVVYQNSDSKDDFEKIAKIDTRNYKNKVHEFTKFKVEKKFNESDTVLLAIKASSHDIAFNSDSLKSYNNIISMYANHDGTIRIDEDWVLYAREIVTVLNELQPQYKNITIVHNMPEALAIIVGMAIGNFWNIQMTQYDRGEYKNIIKLNEVKCYF